MNASRIFAVLASEVSSAFAQNDSHLPRGRQQDADDALRLAKRGLNAAQQEHLEAGSTEMYLEAGPHMTQAFDNSQNSHWMIDSSPAGALAAAQQQITANSSTGNATSTTTSGDLFSAALQAATQRPAGTTSQQQLAEHSSGELQQSFSDWWQEYWSRQPFPSGYTQSSITLVACLLTTIIFLIVVGNLLVCIAIFTEKSLKPTQNWFIASLAVSDMLLGLVVMPFSLARELMGFWIFGPLWCDIHEALDVLLSTASINTLCLISLDRYWSITQAVSYLKKRTPRRAVFMIAAVWVLSAAVSLPPLFGWKKPVAPVVTTTPMLGQQGQSKVNKPSQQQQKPNETADSDDPPRRANSGDDDAYDDQQPPEQPERQQWQRRRRRRRRNNKDASAAPVADVVEQPAGQYAPAPSLLSSLIPSRFARDDSLSAATSRDRDIPDAFQAPLQPVASFQPVITSYAYQSNAGELQLQLAGEQATEYPTCQLSDEVGYVVYSAVGSFFIPCAVMVFTYIKIGLAARKRARRAINKQARAHGQTGGAGKRGAGAGGGGGAAQRRTIAGTTGGRANKQLPVGDSTLLLTPTLGPGGGAGSASSDGQHDIMSPVEEATAEPAEAQLLANQTARRSKSHVHHHRNSRAGLLASEEAERGQSSTPTPAPMMGKLVVVERPKTSNASVASISMGENRAQVAHAPQKSPSPLCREQQLRSPNEIASHDGGDPEEACCAATLITSGSAKLASPSALQCSTSCGGISNFAAAGQNKPTHTVPTTSKDHQTIKTTSTTTASESNDSSLITVMSASMNDLPQVTRFNFQPAPTRQLLGPTSSVPQQTTGGEPAEEDQRAVALLRAISCAGCELAGEPISGDEKPALVEAGGDKEAPQSDQTNSKAANNSTNETCFMTIEEDSDHLEAQTGRTIMMIASNAKQSSCNLVNKSQVGMMMTMLPAAVNQQQQQQSNESTPIVCNNVACLRRRARREANRHGSSYCGSSMTINDDDDEDDDEDDEDDVVLIVDDEEADEDMLASESDGDCLEEDLLTDDCNGFSGSCRLGAYCPGAASSVCAHCLECAALSSDRTCLHDSPLSCTYNTPRDNNSKSTLQDSPQIHICGGSSQMALANQHQAQASQHRTKRRFVCQHQDSSPRDSQDRGEADEPAEEGQSLTGDDNLSLTTDYYRSNEDNSSIVGHDMLDATPAREHFGPKRRSIVASAIASVGGGINRMTSGASHQSDIHAAEAGEAGEKRKKSSIGFTLARFGSSGGSTVVANQTSTTAVSGLLALAASASQQQHQLGGAGSGGGGGNTTRNLKTLRQNFFQKLNQLTAKSASKQDGSSKHSSKGRSPNGGKSSVHSSYGSSYEPSVDCATTSNMPSTGDQYHMETTFAETDDYEPQTSGETTKQSSDQISSGGPQSPAGRLMSMAKQAAAASGVASKQHHQVISSRDVQQRSANKRSHQHAGTNSNTGDNTQEDANRRGLQQAMGTTDEGSSNAGLNQSSSQMSLSNPHQTLEHKGDTRHARGLLNTLDDDRKALVKGGTTSCSGSDLKRRSNDKAASMALVGSSQGSSEQRTTGGTNATLRGQTTGGANSGNNVVSKAFLASDNERHKRKLAKARERRATLILGLIMATFICCWFPFFTFYVLRAICHVCRDYIPPRLEAFIFWMGYCNSAINPIIYTIFNRDFRKAFRKILFRCSRE